MWTTEALVDTLSDTLGEAVVKTHTGQCVARATDVHAGWHSSGGGRQNTWRHTGWYGERGTDLDGGSHLKKGGHRYSCLDISCYSSRGGGKDT